MAAADQKFDRAWNQRAVQWANSAPATVSTNDAPNQALIKAAGIEPGFHTLDLASGTGEPAISIALHVGEQGSVSATDATPAMLAAAKKRAERMSLSNITFDVCPMEQIAFADNRFDAVTCRFGLMHAEDALAGLKQAKRVLKSGKRAACMVHGPGEGNTIWSVVHNVASEFFGIDNSASFAKHFKYSGDGELQALFREAGFINIKEEILSREEERDPGAQIWRQPLERGFAEKIDQLSDREISQLDARLGSNFEKYLQDNVYKVKSMQIIVSGCNQ